MAAVGVMAAFASAGISVPADVSIIGHDNLALSDLSMISLTSVEQPPAEFGRAATSLLVDRLERGRGHRVHSTFDPGLVVRQSTAAVRVT